MSEMVERVARALCLSTCDVNDFPCPQKTRCTEWREYIHEARAAIEAMRTPTEAMVDTGYLHRKTMAEAWAEMITAALDDGTGPIPIYSGKPKE